MKLALRLVLIAAVFAGASHARAAEPAATAAPIAFAYPNHIPANCDNLFVIGDPLPAMRRMFESDTFHDFATNSRLAKKFMEVGTNFAQVEFMLDSYAKHIPVEVAVGFPSATYADIEQLGKMFLAAELCGGATDVGDDAIANDTPEFQQIFLKAALAVKMPQCTVWLRFRDEQTADNVFESIVAAAQQFAESSEIPVTVDENTLHFDFLLVDLVSADMLPYMLSEMGLALDSEDKALEKISDALANFEAEVHLELRGDGLCLQIGRRPPREPAYPVESLGQLWNSDAPILAFGKWRIEELKRCNQAIGKIWEEWRDTPVGKAARRLDEEDMFGTMARLADQIERSADSATYRVTAGESLEATMHEHGFQPIESLVDSPLVKFLPNDTEYVDVDARRSLADYATDWLTEFEDSLAKQWFRAQARGREDRVEEIDRITKFYYGQLADFRRLAFEDTKQVFASPIAVLLGSRGKIDRLAIRFDDEQGQENQIIITDAPMIEYAVIGRLLDPAKPLRLPNEVVRAFLGAYVEDLPDELIATQDLGLGVETFAIRKDVIDQTLESKVKVSIVGDLQPHYFVVDGRVIFSSSIRLSKSILSAWKNPSQRFATPTNGKGEVASFGRIPGATIAAFIDYFFTLMKDAISGEGSVKLSGPVVEQLRSETPYPLDFVFGVSEIIRMLDKIEWTTIDANNIRETRARVTFAKPSR